MIGWIRTPSAVVAAATSLAVTLTVSLGAAPAAATGDQQEPVGDVRKAVFVGSNWSGTADVLAPRTLRRLGRINVVPDKEERLAEIYTDPYRLAYFLAIRQGVGEGHDQFVDDLYTSNNGKLLIASRPSFADVVGLSLRTGRIVWRFEVDGVRSDHMAMSPDGRRVVVSASTGNVAHVLRVRDGREMAKFASGDSPHENIFFGDGEKVLHASIGTVYTPTDQPELDTTKGERVLQVVDTDTWQVKRRYDVRKALDDAGLDRVSHAVRPLTMSPDAKRMYFQLSFFHGFVEMNRRTGRITRFKRLPNLVKDTPREQYLLDSAHHGIAMNPRGTRLCVAGTMSDYATVVDRERLRRGRLLKGGEKPYWVTPSYDGRYCYVSWSGSDTISRISYRTRRIDKTVPVGDHPQRIRNGFVHRPFVAGLPG